MQAGNVPRLDGTHQLVDHGLQRLNLGSKVQIPLAEGIGGAAQGILHRILQHLQLLLRILGEVNLLLVHLLGRFQQVDGMVADAFKITDGVQQGVHALTVPKKKESGYALHDARSGRAAVWKARIWYRARHL